MPGVASAAGARAVALALVLASRAKSLLHGRWRRIPRASVARRVPLVPEADVAARSPLVRARPVPSRARPAPPRPGPARARPAPPETYLTLTGYQSHRIRPDSHTSPEESASLHGRHAHPFESHRIRRDPNPKGIEFEGDRIRTGSNSTRAEGVSGGSRGEWRRRPSAHSNRVEFDAIDSPPKRETYLRGRGRDCNGGRVRGRDRGRDRDRERAQGWRHGSVGAWGRRVCASR